MSFQFMPFYTGDYLRDTRHLTPEEHGVYLLLITYCWDQRGPLPLDERKLCGIANCRSGGEVESLRRVVAEFFVRMDDGLYNTRVNKELTRWEEIAEQAKARGKLSAEARRAKYGTAQPFSESKSKGFRKASERLPNPPSLSPSLSQTPKTKERTRSRAAPPKPDDVDAQVWEDWLALRQGKRAAVTETVLAGARREAQKAGMPLQEFLECWCRRGSQGLEASWIRPDERAGQATVETFAQRAARVRMEQFAPSAAAKSPQKEFVNVEVRRID